MIATIAEKKKFSDRSDHMETGLYCSLLLSCPFPSKPGYKFGFRSSVQKNGLPGEGRHEGLVPRNDVLTTGFIRFSLPRTLARIFFVPRLLICTSPRASSPLRLTSEASRQTTRERAAPLLAQPSPFESLVTSHPPYGEFGRRVCVHLVPATKVPLALSISIWSDDFW